MQLLFNSSRSSICTKFGLKIFHLKYFAGETKYFSCMVEQAITLYPESIFVIVGFSMGGNIVSRYLGEDISRQKSIACAISMCQGYHGIRQVVYSLYLKSCFYSSKWNSLSCYDTSCKVFVAEIEIWRCLMIQYWSTCHFEYILPAIFLALQHLQCNVWEREWQVAFWITFNSALMVL